MQSSEYNLRLFAIQLENLETYLLSNEIFYNLNAYHPQAQPPLASLAIGAILFTTNELSCQLDMFNPKQEHTFIKLMLLWDKALLKWRANMEKKGLREIQSRINLWNAYLSDLQERKDSGRTYPYEVRHRVILTLLCDFVTQQDDVQETRAKLRAMDARLWSILLSTDFIWDQVQRGIYPRDQYRFLYGKPKPSPAFSEG